jgi:acyl-CoA synthetase (NDP forming)
MGYPVVLKALGKEISHKSDVGGIALGLDSHEAVLEESRAMLARIADVSPSVHVEAILVQQQVTGGREVILGGKRDPSFGPVVVFGMGGVYVEVLEDVVFRLAPLNREEAEQMISGARASRLLQGVRGERPSDVDSLIQALLALSHLLVECPEVAEIDINPVLVLEHGAFAVDARVILD